MEHFTLKELCAIWAGARDYHAFSQTWQDRGYPVMPEMDSALKKLGKIIEDRYREEKSTERLAW